MEYLNAVIDDDVYRIDGVKRDTSKMRLLLRSLAFVLITLPVFFKFKNEEIALELFMVSIGSLALSTWYWFRVRKIPEFPEALRLAHKSLMARLSDRLKNKKSKKKE